MASRCRSWPRISKLGYRLVEHFILIAGTLMPGHSSRARNNWYAELNLQVPFYDMLHAENNRAIHLYGERNARLSCLQARIMGQPEVKRLPAFTTINLLFWKEPTYYYSKLCDLWVDKITYFRQWHAFAQETNDKMKKTVMRVSCTILWSLVAMVFSHL